MGERPAKKRIRETINTLTMDTSELSSEDYANYLEWYCMTHEEESRAWKAEHRSDKEAEQERIKMLYFTKG